MIGKKKGESLEPDWGEVLEYRAKGEIGTKKWGGGGGPLGRDLSNRKGGGSAGDFFWSTWVPSLSLEILVPKGWGAGKLRVGFSLDLKKEGEKKHPKRIRNGICNRQKLGERKKFAKINSAGRKRKRKHGCERKVEAPRSSFCPWETAGGVATEPILGALCTLAGQDYLGLNASGKNGLLRLGGSINAVLRESEDSVRRTSPSEERLTILLWV